jgi:hypothetical protein
MVTTVVLARCFALGRVCSIAGLRTADCAHRVGWRMRFCFLYDQSLAVCLLA